MPWTARLDAAGILHHVIIREIERRSIFRDAADREDFLDRLGGVLLRSNTNIHWEVRELGLTGISLARRYHLTQPSIVYAVQRGEKIAREGNYQLLN